MLCEKIKQQIEELENILEEGEKLPEWKQELLKQLKSQYDENCWEKEKEKKDDDDSDYDEDDYNKDNDSNYDEGNEIVSENDDIWESKWFWDSIVSFFTWWDDNDDIEKSSSWFGGDSDSSWWDSGWDSSD